MALGPERELDALQLIAGCLRAGDSVAELGACAHRLSVGDEMADLVRVCRTEAELATLSSLTWLRLASSAGRGDTVRQAIRRHRPRIALGLGASESGEELLAMLGAPDYCAIARVGEILFLAPAIDCEPLSVAGTQGFSDTLRSTFASAQGLLQTGLGLARRSPGSARRGVLGNAARLYRPPTLRSRKLMKLLTDPRRFLDDARSPLLYGPAANLLALVPSRSPRRSRRVSAALDLPKCSILVFLAAGEGLDTEAWVRLCAPLTLATEIVVVSCASQYGALKEMLADVDCPRMRVYCVADAASGQTLLDYGVARCYGSNLAIVRELRLDSGDSISDAFAQLRDDQPYLIAHVGTLVVAKRVRLRDQASPELANAELEAALVEVASRIRPFEHSTLSVLKSDERFFEYSTLALKDCFSEQAHPRVVCLEKRPDWPYPVSTAARAQRPKVSVIMTVYNAAATLPAAVESVLTQSYHNLELLVIDDGSNDGSLEILLELAKTDSRLRVLQTASNSGTYFAKNVGLSFAQGDYVTFHDSDDISAGNRLELQVEALDCDPLAIANYTRYQRVSLEGSEVYFGGATNRPGYITLLFRREQVLAAVGFFDSVRMSADAEFVNRLRLATQRPVRLLPFVSYYALQAEGSLTTAGAGAFSAASDGKMNMPPVRQSYREAADAWHGTCFRDRRLAHIPFPLGKRPFEAPGAILPDRGYSSLGTRLPALTLANKASDLIRELVVQLKLYGEAKLEVKVVEGLADLSAEKKVGGCRKLFLATVDAMELNAPASGLAFAERNLALFADIPGLSAVAQTYSRLGYIKRPLEILREHVPPERRSPLYARLESLAVALDGGVPIAGTAQTTSFVPVARRMLYHVDQSLPFHPLGYALRSQYVLTALQEMGWQALAVTRFGYPSDRRDSKAAWDLSQEAVIDGVRYLHSPDSQGVAGLTPSEQHAALVTSLRKVALERRPCLIHSVSNHVVGLAGARVARELGIPSVYEMRGLWHMTRAARQPAYLDSDHYRMVERCEVQAAAESDFVFTLTAAMKELLVEAGVAATKIGLLPNAVDTELFRKIDAPEDLKRELGLEGKITVGFIGSMNDYEGLDLLLEAVRLLGDRSDYHLLLVGDGPVREQLATLSSALGLDGRVSFTGRVPHERVRDYYALADLLVYPRKGLRVCDYVAPLKPYEALAQEKAVIVSNVRALSEIVETEVSGLVFESGDAAALAEALRRLLGDAALRSRLGKQGRAQVLASHTWQHNAEQLQEVYERLLGCTVS